MCSEIEDVQNLKPWYFGQKIWSERVKKDVCYATVCVACSRKIDILAKRSERVREEVWYVSVYVSSSSIADNVGYSLIYMIYPKKLRVLEEQMLQDDCCIFRRTLRFFCFGEVCALS